MAGDWIKMRQELFTHPKLIALSKQLIFGQDPGLLIYVCGKDALEVGVMPPSNISITDRALRIVTEPALRDVTTCALLRVWCAVNAHCKVDGIDALMRPMGVLDIDDLAGLTGFGDAMAGVGWVIEDSHNSLRFPNFLEFNEPACIRSKTKTGAERQAEFRARQNGVTKSNESNAREEKRREDSLSAKKPREGDDLFRAIVEVTQSDPSTAGPHIGRVRKVLGDADPPYTASDVRALASMLGKRGFTLPITIGTVPKYIGWIRDKTQKVDGKTFEQILAEQTARTQEIQADFANRKPRKDT